MRRSLTGRRVAIYSGVAAVVLMAVLAVTGWDTVRFVLAFENIGKNAQGYPEYRHRKTGIVFVRIPSGKFMMGSPEDEEGHQADEGPVHEVELSAFLIAKYELTQEVWERVMGSNPSHFAPKEGGGPTYPVENVSWNDVQAFCTRTGLKLPTEAQWECACRGPQMAKGGPPPGTGQIENMTWFADNSGSSTHPVGEKQPNGFGLHDIQGNVCEWCEDIYVKDFYKSNLANKKDPVNDSGPGYRVLRGGSWFDPPQHCLSATRLKLNPSGRSLNLGFRPAYSSVP